MDPDFVTRIASVPRRSKYPEILSCFTSQYINENATNQKYWTRVNQILVSLSVASWIGVDRGGTTHEMETCRTAIATPDDDCANKENEHANLKNWHQENRWSIYILYFILFSTFPLNFFTSCRNSIITVLPNSIVRIMNSRRTRRPFLPRSEFFVHYTKRSRTTNLDRVSYYEDAWSAFR